MPFVSIFPDIWKKSSLNAFRTTEIAEEFMREFARICSEKHNLRANGGDKISLSTFVSSPAEIITETKSQAERQRKLEIYIKEFLPQLEHANGQTADPDLIKLIIKEAADDSFRPR
ncbi:MAG: hypothetical protein PHP06_05970 [Clostridia bacterium]|nr:hypothetical protein [Clostridia bacterium]